MEKKGRHAKRHGIFFMELETPLNKSVEELRGDKWSVVAGETVRRMSHGNIPLTYTTTPKVTLGPLVIVKIALYYNHVSLFRDAQINFWVPGSG